MVLDHVRLGSQPTVDESLPNLNTCQNLDRLGCECTFTYEVVDPDTCASADRNRRKEWWKVLDWEARSPKHQSKFRGLRCFMRWDVRSASHPSNSAGVSKQQLDGPTVIYLRIYIYIYTHTYKVKVLFCRNPGVPSPTCQAVGLSTRFTSWTTWPVRCCSPALGCTRRVWKTPCWRPWRPTSSSTARVTLATWHWHQRIRVGYSRPFFTGCQWMGALRISCMKNK